MPWVDVYFCNNLAKPRENASSAAPDRAKQRCRARADFDPFCLFCPLCPVVIMAHKNSHKDSYKDLYKESKFTFVTFVGAPEKKQKTVKKAIQTQQESENHPQLEEIKDTIRALLQKNMMIEDIILLADPKNDSSRLAKLLEKGINAFFPTVGMPAKKAMIILLDFVSDPPSNSYQSICEKIDAFFAHIPPANTNINTNTNININTNTEKSHTIKNKILGAKNILIGINRGMPMAWAALMQYLEEDTKILRSVHYVYLQKESKSCVFYPQLPPTQGQKQEQKNSHQQGLKEYHEMRESIRKAERLLPGNPVLVIGETGVGKSYLAQRLHKVWSETSSSKHHKKEIVSVNCAAIPQSLAESELFGHKRGAFTDAKTDKDGYFKSAANSTLFLDEIGELPKDIQSKMLLVLDAKGAPGSVHIFPLGAKREESVENVRVILATNQNLNVLRQDFLGRISAAVVTLLPLRMRKHRIFGFYLEEMEKWAKHYQHYLAARSTLSYTEMSRPAAYAFLQFINDDSSTWIWNYRDIVHSVSRIMHALYEKRTNLHQNETLFREILAEEFSILRRQWLRSSVDHTHFIAPIPPLTSSPVTAAFASTSPHTILSPSETASLGIPALLPSTVDDAAQSETNTNTDTHTTNDDTANLVPALDEKKPVDVLDKLYQPTFYIIEQTREFICTPTEDDAESKWKQTNLLDHPQIASSSEKSDTDQEAESAKYFAPWRRLSSIERLQACLLFEALLATQKSDHKKNKAAAWQWLVDHGHIPQSQVKNKSDAFAKMWAQVSSNKI